MRRITAAVNAIGILAVWGFMVYGGIPGPWYLWPISLAWAPSPFFALNLLGRNWTHLRAKGVRLLAAAVLCSTTIQGAYTMLVVDPRPYSSGMLLILPFFDFVLLIPFLIAGWVFEHPKDDSD